MRPILLGSTVSLMWMLGCAPSATPTAVQEPSAPGPLGVPEPASPPGEPGPSRSGQEGAACGGIAGLGCSTNLYCEFSAEAQCGAADQTGLCRRVPEMCTEEFAPVCGCNDKTYPNACHAARDAVSVAIAGACAAVQPSEPSSQPSSELSEGRTCGSRGISGDCAAGLYCAYVRNCGADDSGGVCTKKPEICTKIYAPVCGCDGATHASACTAASAGVSVATQGACKKQ